jgi:hypothetical protein
VSRLKLHAASNAAAKGDHDQHNRTRKAVRSALPRAGDHAVAERATDHPFKERVREAALSIRNFVVV